MRHILFAAACTLILITAALALPSAGEPHAELVAQSLGDRTAVETNGDGGSADDGSAEQAPRSLRSPGDDSAAGSLAIADGKDDGKDADEVETEVLGANETSVDQLITQTLSVEEVEEILGVTAAGEDDTTDLVEEQVVDVAPTTTTTSTSTTTTAAPTTTTTAAPVGDGGVIVSSTGVVLPVLGAGANGGHRALTPCGNEVTLESGERIGTVDFVLDPGHGGSEPGAVGPGGATEKALNLRIAEITEWYLDQAGYSVLLTRTTDVRLPLRSRAEIANAVQPLAFVSIHHNGGATRRQDTPGTEMFVDGGNPEARRLGGIMFEEVFEAFSQYEADWVGGWRHGVGTRFNSGGEDLYGIHRFTPGIPSVITEAGYLSNASEEALFIDNDVQWAHGKAIADAMIRWHTTGDAGSGYLDDFVDDSTSGTGGFDGCVDPAL